MKGYLYILKTKGAHYYIGSTNSIERRISEHQAGKTKSLKNLLPIELMFYQEYPEIQTARKAEIKLKKYKNKKIVDRIVKEQKITMGP